MRSTTRAAILGMLIAGVPARAESTSPNYHLVGWANAVVPGSGQALLGNYGTGAVQAGYEISTFVLGYELSDGVTFTLDGAVSAQPTRRLRRNDEIGIEANLTGDMLQEFGIKAHMVNTFNAYRLAARQPDGSLPPGIDGTSTLDMFTSPFTPQTLTDPWVYVPIAGVFTYCLVDYLIELRTLSQVSRVNPVSNSLYTVNYGIWQPIGSGAPEEMFYRGFLQNEFKYWTGGSPYVAALLSSTAFAFSHAPSGRIGAFISGAYLGFLAEKEHGQLEKGITVHFWGDMLLGIETILLYNKAQRATPPMAMNIQVNY